MLKAILVGKVTSEVVSNQDKGNVKFTLECPHDEPSANGKIYSEKCQCYAPFNCDNFDMIKKGAEFLCQGTIKSYKGSFWYFTINRVINPNERKAMEEMEKEHEEELKKEKEKSAKIVQESSNESEKITEEPQKTDVKENLQDDVKNSLHTENEQKEEAVEPIVESSYEEQSDGDIIDIDEITDENAPF